MATSKKVMMTRSDEYDKDDVVVLLVVDDRDHGDVSTAAVSMTIMALIAVDNLSTRVTSTPYCGCTDPMETDHTEPFDTKTQDQQPNWPNWAYLV